MTDATTASAETPLAQLAGALVGMTDQGVEPSGDTTASRWRRALRSAGWSLRLRLVNLLAMSPLISRSARRWLLRAVGYRVAGATLESGTVIRSRTLAVGPGSFVNHRCFFASGDIVLGRDVFVSTGVSFMTGDHRLGPHERRAGEDYEEPIVVEDGCWIGANVVLLHGVRVAAGCVVGAGAVVTKDTEPDGVYVGVPARRVRDLD